MNSDPSHPAGHELFREVSTVSMTNRMRRWGARRSGERIPPVPAARGWLGFVRRNRADAGQGFVALLISSAGDLVAGIALGSMTDSLQRLPGLLILVPAAIGMRGNIFGALGSRLGTVIHTGRFRRPLRSDTPAGQSVAGASLLTIYVSLALGIMAWVVAQLLGVRHITVFDFVVISVLGGLASSIVVLAVTLIVAHAGARRGWDLDNVAAPVVTAAGDMVTLPALWGASFLVPMRTVTYSVAGACLALVVLAAMWQARKRLLRTLQLVVWQSLPLLLLAGLFDLAAGYTIDRRSEQFFVLPALLVLVPPFLEDAGALGGILAARLSSKLHLGLISPSVLPGRRSWGDIALTFVLAVPVFTLVATSTALVSGALGLAGPGLGPLVAVALLAGLIATIGAVFAAYYTSVIAYRLGLDPDNYGIPMITSSIDLMGTLALIGAIILIGLA